MIPSIDSPLWQTLKVPETTRKSIIQRRFLLFVGPAGPMFVCWLVGLGILVPSGQAPFLLEDLCVFSLDFDRRES